jgi:hypothetical protein
MTQWSVSASRPFLPRVRFCLASVSALQSDNLDILSIDQNLCQSGEINSHCPGNQAKSSWKDRLEKVNKQLASISEKQTTFTTTPADT